MSVKRPNFLAIGHVTNTRWPEETKVFTLRAARVLFFSEEEFALNRDEREPGEVPLFAGVHFLIL